MSSINRNGFIAWVLAVAGLLPASGRAQTLIIAGGVQQYTALTNTAVSMSGQCELWLSAATNPAPGCTINLTSPDAWLFLPNVRPSVAGADYLSQVQVNGAPAVAGGNCQLTEYAMGSVIIPQAPGFAPLHVFTGPNFAGATAQFGVYTYYNPELRSKEKGRHAGRVDGIGMDAYATRASPAQNDPH